MDVHDFLKSRYEVFYELLKNECKTKGWNISFDATKLFHDIRQINGHDGIGISQYPKVNREEIIMDEGWRLIFDYGYANDHGDDTIDLSFKGTFYNPNNVEYPFTYKATYFWNNALSEMEHEEEVFDYSKGVPSDITEQFIEIMHEKARWGV
jgi:hypothetical protein